MAKMKLAYVIGTYPSLTTTFIDREIRILRTWGVEINIVAIRRPASSLSAEQDELRQGVSYLLPISLWIFLAGHLYFSVMHPVLYFGILLFLLTRPGQSKNARWMTLLHFGEGVYAAQVLRSFDCEHIHAHFVDRAATVAMVASHLLGIPYSVTAHARDIYVSPVLLLEKMERARFVATCTEYNKAHLSGILSEGQRGKIKRIYHGLDTNNHSPDPHIQTSRPVLISVGQLKEKKGHSYLLEACMMLKNLRYDFECQIVGDGPMREMLEKQIHDLYLDEIVTLCGALPHSEVVQKYRQSTIFVLPSVTSADGDRDGIPNVILEAMSMKLPVVSTQQSGIPEVIENGVNGLLVPPTDVPALANALAQLLDDTALRERFGSQGRQTVLEKFDIERNVGLFLAEFQHANEER